MDKLQSFACIGHSFDQEFNNLVLKLLFLLKEYGISKLRSDPDNIESLLEFASLVHEGWKKAHQLICQKITHKLNQLSELEKQKKNLHKLKKKDEKKGCIKAITITKREILVLRRLYDSIAWSMLLNENSTVRRFQVAGGHTNLSIENIAAAMPALDSYNDDPLKIAICADVTTFIQSGDILLFDYMTGSYRVIELKSAGKGIELSKAAITSLTAEDENFERTFKATLNTNDSKQYDRIRRQYVRGTTICDIINNEAGVDHTGKTVQIISTDDEPQPYAEAIVDCFNQLNENKSWAINCIDECLYIGVYNNVNQAFVGFCSWMDGIGCDSHIYNLTDSFRNIFVRPFASLNLPSELLKKVFCGDIIIVMCLDVPRFIDLANSIHPNFLFLKDPEESKKFLDIDWEIFSYKGQVIGCSDMEEGGTLGQGLIDRIIYDFERPSSMIKIFKKMIQS